MSEPEKATEKAKEIVAMSVHKVSLSEPLHEAFVDVVRSGLVIGGGIAGMTAALELANQDYSVYLIEKGSELGGLVRNLYYTVEGDNPQKYLKNLIEKVKNSEKITTLLNTKIEEVSGFVGNFKIKVNSQGEMNDLEAGALIVATGGSEYKPTEYLYGQNERILTQHELEQQISKNKIETKTVVMIQCVGSRNEDRRYCSKICCTSAIKNALKLKEINPKITIYILYRDIRTYGLLEDYYREARKRGVIFIKYEAENPPEVIQEVNQLAVKVNDIAIQRIITLRPDLLVLSAAFIPTENKDLSQMLKVPLDQNGFFLEAHVKLRPLDFATDGIFLCGTAQWPKPIRESIAQAMGAATRAIRILSAKQIKTDAIVATVDHELCIGCGACELICPFHAPRVERTESGQKSIINASACKGCGTCGASCPQKAISMQRFTDVQIIKQLDTISEKLLEREA